MHLFTFEVKEWLLLMCTDDPLDEALTSSDLLEMKQTPSPHTKHRAAHR